MRAADSRSRSPWHRKLQCLAVAGVLVPSAGCETAGGSPAPATAEPTTTLLPNESTPLGPDRTEVAPSAAAGGTVAPGSGGTSSDNATPSATQTQASRGGSPPTPAVASGTPSGGAAATGGAPAVAAAGGTGAVQTPNTAGGTGDAGQNGGGVAGAATSGADAGTAGSDGGTFAGKELFILFGQSNMSGMSPMPDEWVVDENITFMVQYDCPSRGQTKDEWLPAQPPLHGCQWATNGIGLGLADYFGVAIAAAWSDAQIGLIPNAIPAVTIDVFMKDGPSPGGGMKALPDGYTSAYALMVDRAKEAQQLGRIRGILMHQGESDFNQGLGEEWLGKLTTVVLDLRADLELSEDVPFIAGQISPDSNYSGHNVYVDQVPSAIPNSAVVSAEGTLIHDVAHFDLESARLMGERYAEAVLELTTTR